MAIDYNLIGIRLKNARIKKGYTQEKLSEIIGVTDAYVSRIERGSAHISLPRLDEFCTLLDITMSYVLSGVSENSEDYLNPQISNLLKDRSPEEKKAIYKVTDIVVKEIFSLKNSDTLNDKKAN